MDERVVQFRVGVMVVATLIIGAILALLFGDLPSLVEETYTIQIRFPSAPGVTRDTPVRKSGILVGRVGRVELLDQGGVLVTADIQSKYRLRHSEVCQISGSLLGDAVLQFVPASQLEPMDDRPIRAGERIEGTVASDPLQSIGNLEGELAATLRSVARTSEEINLLVRNVSTLLENNTDQLSRIVNKTEHTLDEIRAAANNTNDLVSDPVLNENLRKAITDLPDALAEMRQAVAGMQRTMATADRNLKNIEGLTEPLGERGEQLIDNIDRATGRLDELVEELTVFSRQLNDSEGSVGRLINDPALYDNLSEAAENINRLTRDLEPILKDARVFTDKVARHPEVIGLGGLLRRSSGIK